MLDDVRSWAHAFWRSTESDRQRPQVDDPFISGGPLLQFAPASWGKPTVVAYPTNGAQHTILAALDVPYRSRNGTVHVVCPVGPDHGAIETAIENVAEQIRLQDPSAAALIIAWPNAEEPRLPEDPMNGLLGAHHFRVTFDRFNHRAAEKSANGIAEESRYGDPQFDHQDPSEHVARAVFGEDNPFPTTYAEVETVLSLFPELAAAVAEIEEGWQAERARPERSAEAARPEPASAESTEPESAEKPSKYTLLLSDTDALMWDQLAVTLRRELGRKIDKSAMVRSLVGLAVEDVGLRRQLIATLERQGTTRRPDLGL